METPEEVDRSSAFTIEITKVSEQQGSGWMAECVEIGSTHVRTSLAAAVMAVTIEVHDHAEPYED